MKRCLFGLSSLLLVIPGSWAEEQSGFDAVAALRSLEPGKSATLVIPPGVYRLPKEGVRLENLKDVTIDAKGVLFVATSFAKGTTALRFENCDSVTLRGLTLDYDPLPFTQGTITALDPEKRTAEFMVHAGYPELSEPYLVERCHLFDGDTGLWKVDAPDYYLKKIERLSATTGRITLKDEDKGWDRLKVGDRIVLNVRQAPALGIMNGCRNMTIEDCTIHAGAGLGIIVRFAEEAGTFRRVSIVPGPPPAGASEPRLFSTSADAFNVAYTRRGPLVEDCEFSFMGDDSINLHGVTLPVLKWLDGRTFLSMRPQRGEAFDVLIRPGDEVRFLKEPDFQMVKSARVTGIRRVEQPYDEWKTEAKRIWPTFRESSSATFFEIKLDEDVTGLPMGMFCEIPATAAPGYVIRNSRFHDHRARGLRLMSPDGLVENNVFERIKGAAISVGPEFAYWKEAGWVRNLVIRGNTFKDIGQGTNLRSEDSYTPGAVSVFSHIIPAGEKTVYYPGNEDIRIEDNTFDGCSMDAVNVSAAKGVKISGNTIRQVNLSGETKAGRLNGLRSGQAITVTQAEALVENNKTE